MNAAQVAVAILTAMHHRMTGECAAIITSLDRDALEDVVMGLAQHTLSDMVERAADFGDCENIQDFITNSLIDLGQDVAI